MPLHDDHHREDCPKVYLLMGPSGSGKTSYYEKKLKQRNLPLMGIDREIDMLLRSTIADDTNIQTPFSLLRDVAKEARDKHINELLEQRKNFVYDGTGKNTSFYRELIEKFKESDFQIVLILLVAKKKDIFNRLEERSLKTNQKIPESVAMKSFGSYQSFFDLRDLADESVIYFANNGLFHLLSDDKMMSGADLEELIEGGMSTI